MITDITNDPQVANFINEMTPLEGDEQYFQMVYEIALQASLAPFAGEDGEVDEEEIVEALEKALSRVGYSTANAIARGAGSSMAVSKLINWAKKTIIEAA